MPVSKRAVSKRERRQWVNEREGSYNKVRGHEIVACIWKIANAKVSN